MTQEEKDLLLKDLCARLSYNLVVQIEGCGIWNFRGIDHDNSAELRDRVIVWHGKSYPSSKNSFPIISCKPFLFPLSSMTEEQKQYLKNRFCYDWDGEPYDLWTCQIKIGDTDELIDWFNKNHFDWRGLIEMGLVIDATGLNIY